MCTNDEYGDFTLELDFKVDSRDSFNSGVQIRSHARPEGKGERVYGYQVEMDTDPDRAWTGGIYFEGGSKDRPAGWLNELGTNEAAQKARKLDDWNHFKIECKGRNIKTWVNGVPAADFTDKDDKAFAPKGFIALQVHGVGDLKEPREVRWKNIKLTVHDLERDRIRAPAVVSSQAALRLGRAAVRPSAREPEYRAARASEHRLESAAQVWRVALRAGRLAETWDSRLP
jgi:hypothetical protein